MPTPEAVKKLIQDAFADARYPGDRRLRGSDEGDEPFAVEDAFRFYLPAYLVADLDGQLDCSDPVFHLTHGLERRSAPERLNPRRFGDRTRGDYARERFAGFTSKQTAAIVAYLTWKRDSDSTPGSTRREIEEALECYWGTQAKSSHE
jgi:hypothetical protein